MQLKTTSDDLGIIKIFFDCLPQDGVGNLEVITEDGQIHQSPSWSEIQGLYRKYGRVTLEYNRPE